VGFRDKTKFLNFSFPYPVALTVGVRDLLEMDVPERFYWRSDHTKDVAKDDRVYQWRRNYIRANKSGLCPTLTANTGTGGNNVPLVSDNRGVRRLTDRECLRLQGFPDTFAFPDNVCLSQRYKQIGNSVSVPVVSSIVEKMLWAFYSKEVPTIKDTQGVQLGLF
jgi:DNA (cytosine-5)-methyltransferase 1